MSNDHETVRTDAVAETAGIPTPAEIRFDAKSVEAKMTQITRAIDACTKISIQRTNPADWVRMGKGYYLTAAGALKIRTIWGIYFRNMEVAKEQRDGGGVSFVVTGEVGSKLLDNWYGSEVTIEGMGARSTDDGFFRDNTDEQDVKKAAIANFRARAVTAILGIENMTEADLQKNGINTENVTAVEFKKGSQGGATATESDKEVQVKLYNALVDFCESTDEKVMGDFLETLTTFTGKDGTQVKGLRSIKQLKGKRLQVAYSKISTLVEKREKTITDSDMGQRTPGREG